MLLPIGDDNTKRVSFPIVTIVLIAVNAIIFFLELQRGDTFVIKYSVIPLDFASGIPPFHTLITAMFLHAGWAHLLGNMLYLFVFGDNVEDRLGKLRYLIFYLLCGVIAFVAQIIVYPNSNIPNLGASGAISGVLAAYLVLYPKNKVRVLMGFFLINVSAWFVLGLWIVTQFFSGYTDVFNRAAHATGGVAYMAHIGGFVSGVILVLLFRPKRTSAAFENHQ
jgi:membrane associated rhomboid family serine protease